MDDLRQEMEKRKAWFFECQLRKLNLFSFRNVHEPIPGSGESPDPLLDIVSESLTSFGFPTGQFGKMESLGRVYLDSQQPVWTVEEREQRDAFAAGLIGRIGNWLDFKRPKRIAANLEALKNSFESSLFGSVIDKKPDLNYFKRKDALEDKLADAISRASVAIEKPWLIPELYYNTPIADKDISAAKWLNNAKTFVSNFEVELLQICGKSHNDPLIEFKFDPEKPDKFKNEYKNSIRTLMEQTLTQSSSDFVKVSFLGEESEEKGKKTWDLKVQTVDFPPDRTFGKIDDYHFSNNLAYWSKAFDLKDIYLGTSDSDMGLCTLMRALYLFGTLPSTFESDSRLEYRYRPGLTGKFQHYIFYHFFPKMCDQLAKELSGNQQEFKMVQQEFKTVREKLTALLELQVELPRSAALSFSPLYAEFCKQAILQYKFWLDEPFNADNNNGEEDKDKPQGISKARKDLGIKKEELFKEMEYWSENHYIMFASSELLAGQLWPKETFQPARDFLGSDDLAENDILGQLGVQPARDLLGSDDKFGQLSGDKRQARAKARVLKWLNTKLLFGWTEFNASGYYREHILALLNLVDFALDEEIRKKATIVLDLLLFDLVRFQHKGAMGAAGGRSQFKSKCNGWDNGPGDVIEIMLGTRGIFIGGDLGSCFATTTYKVPNVLLEIGKNPPDFSFIDRSRVSISFEEAPKYGIQYSQKSDQKDSIEKGFALKRDKYFKPLADVNEAIRSTHNDYGQMEDDTIFWWTMSAYFNQQVVRNTFTCREKFHLQNNDPFTGLLPMLISYILPALRRSAYGVLGGVLGSAIDPSNTLRVLAGTAGGFFLDDILVNSDREGSSNELSIFLEGSTRTRANILTYRNKDVMLSSVQNFRPGQLNFQSNVQMATISGEISVFTMAAYPGLSVSDIPVGLLGALAGAPIGAYAMIGGAVALIAVNEGQRGENLIGNDEDGPGYWTGYWSLPMVLQHENSAIIAYDFHWIQRRLTDASSHAWFPRNAFDSVEERRTSAYKDQNFFLLDTTDIGPKGYWIFGKKTHKKDTSSTQENEEAYIGLFSNQRPEWLNKDSDFYRDKVKKKEKDLLRDYFADRDWSVEGKNIWIVQVGNKKDYGSFDSFKDKVSKAKIELDDVGTMQCTYHIPKPDGNSQALSLEYGRECKLDGNAFQTDLYPRFENPFVRGGRVEWGQREYVIEYGGKSLLHEFNDLKNVQRLESPPSEPGDLDSIHALVIYITTGDENMDQFSVGQATVKTGYDTLASDEIIAAGEVPENTTHDAEFIFFDHPGMLTPDMTIELKHPATSDGDDEPAWNMSFTLKALMGDHRLYDCALSFSSYHFKDGYRSSGTLPFTVQVSRWHRWQPILDISYIGNNGFWQVAVQPGYESYYYDHFDLFVISYNRLLHRKVASCATRNTDWSEVGASKQSLLFEGPFSIYSLSAVQGNLFVFAVRQAELSYCFAVQDEDIHGKSWIPLKPQTVPTLLFGIPDPDAVPRPIPLFVQSKVFAVPTGDFQGTINLYLSAADNAFYSVNAWYPGSLKNWRKISTEGVFKPLPGSVFHVDNNYLYALDQQRHLWVGWIQPGNWDIKPIWVKLTGDSMTVNSFKVVRKGSVSILVLNSGAGEIYAAPFTSADQPIDWERVGAAVNFLASPQAPIAWAVPREGHLDIFIIGQDGKVYTTWWEASLGWEMNHNWFQFESENQKFTSPTGANIVALNRAKNQIEILIQGEDQKIWYTWWS